VLRIALVLFGITASVATSAPRFRYPRTYATWQVSAVRAEIAGCAEVKTWVGKSGKSGVGLVVEVRTRARACRVSLLRVSVRAGSHTFTAPATPPAVIATPEQPTHLWVAVPFDNESAWNRGERDGVVEFELLAGDTPRQIAIPIEQRRNGNHRKVDRFHDVRRAEPAQQPNWVTPNSAPATDVPMERAQ